MADEGLDSVCVIDSPNPSPTDAKRAPFDFAAVQMVSDSQTTSFVRTQYQIEWKFDSYLVVSHK
jgi:hypothetical protein